MRVPIKFVDPAAEKEEPGSNRNTSSQKDPETDLRAQDRLDRYPGAGESAARDAEIRGTPSRTKAEHIPDRDRPFPEHDGAEPEPEAGGSRPYGDITSAGPSDRLGPDGKILSWEGRYLRLKADFENHKRRSQKESDSLAQAGREAVLQDLIPLLEQIERAIEACARAGQRNGIREGIELVRGELLAVMGKNGLERIATVGQRFDPLVHEAVAVLPGRSVPPNTILEEVRPGFSRQGKPLRPAAVVVAS